VRRAVLLVVLALVLPASASAQNVSGAATGLKTEPLYVDPALRSAITAQERKDLTQRLRGTKPPVLVALVPLASGDSVDGEPRQLLTVLRSRVGRPDALYATASEGSLTVLGPAAEDEHTRAASSITNLSDHDYDERLATTLNRFLDALADPNVIANAEKVRKAVDDEQSPTPAPARAVATEQSGRSPLLWVLLAVVVVLLLALVFVARRRRGARPAGDSPLVLPEYVFQAAYGARRRELRTTVEHQLVELSATVDAAPVPALEAAQNHYQRALDARDAASRILDDKQASDADLIGALVLEDLAQRELGAARAGKLAPPLCALNPTHGRSSGTGRWGASPPLPVCAACRRDLLDKRAPDVLDDGGRPYLERDTVWARTAFGALVSDLPAELVRFHHS